ncbi:hypothetical protein EXU48_20055 [Occultella glacieicola]|uniref:non-specific serine/threonine protein kinase n=1 Tax=Occultella glacieicola TaxID=2518684 RepID=A0ABY2DYA2_9MICO|nr:protein kinase [Occultella glacieicola]TDE89466.1 hypothetical protein EXU48_20055 [Occultella glacieicola]
MDGGAPQIPGYLVDGPLGLGAEARVWAARELGPRGRPVAIRLTEPLEPDARAARQRRLGALARIDHAGLARVLAVLDCDDGRSAVVQDLVDGATLATVRAARHGLDLAETVGLVSSVAGSLAALHQAGVVHGDVSPANIVLANPDAQPVLVDLLGGSGLEAGTDGFRAPEVATGHEVSTATDVYGLGAVARWAVADTDRVALREVLGDLTAGEPRARPSLVDLRDRLRDRESAPIRLPDARVLAGASLREQARREETIRRPVRRARRRARHRRSRRWQVAACLVMLLGAAVGAATLTGWRPVFAEPAAPSPAGGAGSMTGPASAVITLTAERDRALMTGDAVALAALSVPGSPADAADAQLLTALRAAEIELVGLETTVTAVDLVRETGEEAVVRALLTQGAHERRTADGAEPATMPALAARCVEFTLAAVDRTWLVRDLTHCPD